jgi:hypothetical protein
MADAVEIKDFSFSVDPIPFTINEDVFECVPELPLWAMQQMARINQVSEAIKEHGVEPILEVFDIFLLEDSAVRFRERVMDRKKPIGIRHIMAILPWLLEQYGVRPTQPSLPSSNGSNDGETGTSSEDGVSPSELIPLS